MSGSGEDAAGETYVQKNARQGALLTAGALILCAGCFTAFKLPFILLVLAASTCLCALLFYLWVLVAPEYDEQNRRFGHHDNMVVMIQVIVFIFSMTVDADGYDTLVVGNALFAVPVSLAGSAKSVKAWRICIAIHFAAAALCLGLRGQLHTNLGQMLVVLAFVDLTLDDVARARIIERETAREREQSHDLLKNAAKLTVNKMFEDFCDASVELDSEGFITEAAPRLAALLGASQIMPGRNMESLIHKEDVEDFRLYMTELLHQKRTGETHMERHSYSVRLQDAFGQPIPVHLFHTPLPFWKDGETISLGILEAWLAKKKKKQGLLEAGPELSRSLHQAKSSGRRADSPAPAARTASPVQKKTTQKLSQPLLQSSSNV
eukprot:TRINITY_DN41393_c0_g1_i1.p1 TRINITY_DN41393_c0_g1~~TRINITY_DN41393_c0_g1_i1.p1  ORF type:complete len:378 (+),score=61.91 TRINITY_DN41393_c0_g1_i1:104-1237(+)